jgi:hypothetical protein
MNHHHPHQVFPSSRLPMLRNPYVNLTEPVNGIGRHIASGIFSTGVYASARSYVYGAPATNLHMPKSVRTQPAHSTVVHPVQGYEAT